MSKIFVIKDWEKFWSKEHLFGKFANTVTYPEWAKMEDIKRLLEKHELKVVEFEAEVDGPLRYAIASKAHLDTIIHLITKEELPFKRNDKLRVFVVKKEEKTDEKDVPHS